MLLASVLSGGGIVVRDGAGLQIGTTGGIRVDADLDFAGELHVRGRLEIGRDVRLASARFEGGSELVLADERPHRLDIPADLALWNVTWSGSLAGELRPVLDALRTPGSQLRKAGSPPSHAAASACAGAFAETGEGGSGVSHPLKLVSPGRPARRAIEAPRDRGPPHV
ncbi:MAG: hypothetical protein HYY17_09110 [Planctomycetes bacterium]|nr:hypothetical protein [Planctomycetota bacterium]